MYLVIYTYKLQKGTGYMDENNLVVKANKFIEAKGRMTTLEQKLIAGLISEITPEDEDFQEYDLNISELKRDLRITDTRIYETLKETANNLQKKDIVLEEITPKGKKKFIVTRIISSAEYVEGEGRIKIRFDPVLKPYFIGLQNQFTKYQLKHILELKGSHSIRIYELLKQCQVMKKREFMTEQLKEILGLQNEYERFYDFEKYVLKTAKNEINKKTDITIDYEKIKEGRKIEKIKFSIEAKYINQEEEENRYYRESGAFDFDEIREKSGLNEVNFNDTQILKLYTLALQKTEHLDIDTFDYIKLNYEYILKKPKKSPYAYLKSAIENDYAGAIYRLTLAIV